MKNNLVCVQCDSQRLVAETVKISGERNGEQFVVEVPGYACRNCGFATVDSTQSGRFTQALSDAYRKAHGLLTSSDLKNLRQKLHMSQVEFATYLGVGAASVKRWECGQIQDKAMDELIRLKTDPEAALRNAHKLNPACPILEAIGEGQIYSPKSNIELDMSSLEESEILTCMDEPVAA